MEQKPRTIASHAKTPTRRSVSTSAARSASSSRKTPTRSVSSSRSATGTSRPRTAPRHSSNPKGSATRAVNGSRNTAKTVQPNRSRNTGAPARAPKSSPKKTIIVAIIALLLVFGLVDHVMNHDKAYSGVRIGVVDCGGKTVDEIASLLETTYGGTYEEKEVRVFVSEEAKALVEETGVSEVGNEDLISVEEGRDQRLMWSVFPETVSASFDERASAVKAVEEAHGITSIFSRLAAFIVGRQLDPVFQFGDAYKEFLDEVNNTVGYQREDYDIWLEDGECYISIGHDGMMVNEAQFKQNLISGFFNLDEEPYGFVAQPEVAPIRITKEDALKVVDQVNAAIADGANFIYEGTGWNATRNTVSNWINSKIEMQDGKWVLIPYVDPDRARSELLSHVKNNGGEDVVQVQFSVGDGGKVSVHTDASGVMPLVDEAIEDLNTAFFGSGKTQPQSGAMAEDGEAVTINIQSSAVPSEMSFDDALHYGLIGEISSFTTSYTYGTSSTETRNFNIHLCADLLNNSICKSGGIWSFHETAGECNEERGFKEAGVIEEGVYSTSFGGGICQVATTVFNAAYEAGYYIERRYNHTIYNSSYPAGRDAAVSWPDLDLIWSNDTDSDILLTTSHTEGTVTVTLWGVSPERLVESYVSDWEEGDKYKKEYVENTELAPKTYRIKTHGSDGRSIYVERTVYDKNGEQISFQRFRSSYDAVNEIIEYGEGYEIPEEDEEDK